MMKKFLPVLSAIALALPAMVHAGTTSVLFDADGAGALYAPTAVDLLDLAPGNALSLGGADVVNGQTAQLLYQANLGLTSLNGATKTVSCFLGASCITAVAGFQETAKVNLGANPGDPSTVSFTLAGGGPLPSATNFFYLYANAAAGNNLAGTGFATFNGGTNAPILSGYISALTSSNFTADGTTGLFDQSGGDDYSGKQTMQGSGSTDLTITITSSNADYFPGLNVNGLAFSFFNTSAVDPFKQVDPSRNFSSNGQSNGNVVANLGAVNGARTGAGNDFQFQADGNQSFIAVPEPGSITLVGLALAGLGFARRRRA